jgi:hypothetical protein
MRRLEGAFVRRVLGKVGVKGASIAHDTIVADFVFPDGQILCIVLGAGDYKEVALEGFSIDFDMV